MSVLLIVAGAILVFTAGLHSVRGEQKLIGALLAGTSSPVARRAIRYTWHMAGLLMALTGLTIGWPGTPAALIILIAVTYLGLGLVSLWMTRGRHVSGPAFTVAALLAIGGVAAGPGPA